MHLLSRTDRRPRHAKNVARHQLPLPLAGRMAERSKALASGASPKGRGFESHFCQTLCFYFLVPKMVHQISAQVHPPASRRFGLVV